MTTRPILLTGSAGFVGGYIDPMLRAAFPERPLVPVVRVPPAPAGGQAVDLTERETTERLVADVRPGVVVHLAAHSSVGTARLKPSGVWRDNVDASTWVARAVARHAPDATVLVASTAEVYGRNLNRGPADEATPPAPSGPYACSKLAAEHVFRSLLPDTAQLVIVRPFNHVGRGQSENFAIPSFAAQLARIEAGLEPPVLRVGNLQAERDFLDVRDVADCYVSLLRQAADLPRRLLVNVARGQAVSIQSLLDILLGLARVPVEVEVDPVRLRPNEVPVATASTRLLSTLIEWPPKRPLRETLADVMEEKRQAIHARAEVS